VFPALGRLYRNKENVRKIEILEHKEGRRETRKKMHESSIQKYFGREKFLRQTREREEYQLIPSRTMMGEKIELPFQSAKLAHSELFHINK
jgi:hypothetical protein